MIIGLTGPVGSGKTEAAKIFKKIGAYIIEADLVGHKILADPLFEKKLLDEFKTANRKKISDIVFADLKRLKKLNLLLHPNIIERIQYAVESVHKKEKNRLIVIDAALPCLFEKLVDEVWVVWASKKNRVKRLLKRGFKKKKILQIMKSQPSKKDYIKIADKIIINEGDFNQFKSEILGVFRCWGKSKFNAKI